jgi:hypothetical protein
MCKLRQIASDLELRRSYYLDASKKYGLVELAWSSISAGTFSCTEPKAVLMSSGPTNGRTSRLRFRLRTLLLLPLVFALGWWWVTWPQRTINRLDELVAAGDLDQAASLIVFEPDYRYPPDKVAQGLQHGRGQPHTAPANRNLIDLVLGRRRFEIDKKGVAVFVNTGEKSQHMMIESVTVERGRIKYEWGLSMIDFEQERIRNGK